MTGHQSEVPAAVRAIYPVDQVPAHPTIVQVFVPGKGWRRSGWHRKLVSVAACRKLNQQGVTHVALDLHGLPTGSRNARIADFGIKELTR